MINRKIVVSGLSIVTALSLMTGATFAYFTDSQTSTGNTLATGSMSVSITDQNADTDFVDETLGTNWMPGESKTVEFDVKNTGTLPVHLRGFAAGTWNNVTLDGLNKVKVTKVERWDGAAWQSLIDQPTGVTGLFYYTNNGTDTGTFFEVAPNGRAQLRLTVMLDATADSQFEASTFTSSITVHAKQTTAGATWPTP